MSSRMLIKGLRHPGLYGTFLESSDSSSSSMSSEFDDTNSDCCRRWARRNYGYFVCAMLITNFLIGNGFLALPYALYQAGLLYGVLTLLVLTFISYVSSMWTLEVMSRAQAVEYRQASRTIYQVDDALSPSVVESHNQSPDRGSDSSSYRRPVPTYEVVPTRKFELFELCRLFLGRTGQIFYLISLTAFLIFTCWAYSTVVGTTLSSAIPWQPVESWRMCTANDFKDVYIPEDISCRKTYWFYIGVFACLALPLSCLDLNKQHIFQIFTTIVRLTTVTLMTGECIYDIVHGHFDLITHGLPVNSTNGRSSGHLDVKNAIVPNSTIGPSELYVDPLKFSFVGWLWCIPVILVAQVVQQSIPTIVYRLRNPSKLGRVFFFTFAFSAMFDVVYGVSVAWRFGHDIAENSALSWAKQRKSNSQSRAVIAYIISFLPSLDVMSLFPMLTVTLANNLFVAFFGRDTSSANYEEKVLFLKKVLFRVGIAAFTITGSVLISNLFYVSKYGGIVGTFIAILFPAALQYASKQKCKRIFASLVLDFRTETSNHVFPWMPINQPKSTLASFFSCNDNFDALYVRSKVYTPYSTIFSSNLCVILCALFGLGIIFCSVTVYAIVQ